MPEIACRLVSDRTWWHSGEPEPAPLEPGDMYWFIEHESGKCSYWDNCDGRHLFVTLPAKSPGGWYYTHDLTARVANCSMPEDRIHRCRIIIGEPPKVTLKAGCSVGHSIGFPWPQMEFHGFLVDGVLKRLE